MCVRSTEKGATFIPVFIYKYYGILPKLLRILLQHGTKELQGKLPNYCTRTITISYASNHSRIVFNDFDDCILLESC